MLLKLSRIGFYLSVYLFWLFLATQVYAIDAVDIAADKIGKKYILGAKGSEAFDCSGLIQYSYAQIGISLPGFSGDQANVGVPVLGELQRGDLLFFATDDERPGALTHVAIYENNNEMIHAVSPKLGIRRDNISSPLWSFLFARRVITIIQQSDSAAVDTVSRGNPVQLLGSNISGTFKSLEVKYDGVGASNHFYHVIILEYQDSSYNRFTRREYFSNNAKSSAGSGTKTDKWNAADFGSTIVFDKNKFYAFMLYQLDAKPRGSNTDAYLQGCYVQEEPSGQFVSCNPSNVNDMYFVLTLNP